MKVLALTDCLLGYHSFWIRVGQYLQSLKNEFKITISDNKDFIKELGKGDKLIFYRYSMEWGDLSSELQRAKERGVIIITDVDDYLWNDGLRRGWAKQRLRLYTRSLRICNLITCSTNYLKQQLKVMFRDRRIILLENTAPPKLTEVPKKASGKLRIGWTGAPWTRPYDLDEIKSLAKWACEKKDEIQLVHIGHSEKHLSFANALNIEQSMVETTKLNSYEQYINEIKIDIGLAPLQKSCFNSFKSAIKVIEYSANSIPWIASDVEVYRYLCTE